MTKQPRAIRSKPSGAFKPAVTLSHALRDPSLLGGPFVSPSFWTWKVVAKAIDGLLLTEPREAELFHTCTGRSRLPIAPVKRITLLAGRRAGKDRFLSAVAVWRAALCADWRRHISAGEQAVVILLGGDRKQASILRRYCEGLLRTPLLAQEVVRQTGEVTEFRNGSSLEIITNNASLVRGRSAIAVLGSEASHWKTGEHATSNDEEVVGAAEPSMAMCPDGGLLMLGSSVHRKAGLMYRRYRELHGNNDADAICWFAPSTTMNPKLPLSVIEQALASDAAKASAEYLNVFREDLSDFIPLDVIESCTDRGIYERAPDPNLSYVGFVDAAGGTGTDSFTFCIAHRDRDNRASIDVLREFKPRFVPAAVIGELAQLCRRYKITAVQGDGFAGGFHASEWTAQGIKFVPCDNTTSENYLAALPLLLSGRVRLLDNGTLRSQLGSLERRVHAQDRQTVSHPQVASAHDDLATACCGALVLAVGRMSDVEVWRKMSSPEVAARVASLGSNNQQFPQSAYAYAAQKYRM